MNAEEWVLPIEKIVWRMIQECLNVTKMASFLGKFGSGEMISTTVLCTVIHIQYKLIIYKYLSKDTDHLHTA